MKIQELKAVSKKWFVLLIFLIILGICYTMVIQKEVIILEWILLGLAVFLLCIQIFFLWKNGKDTKISRKKRNRKRVTTTSFTPYETYLLSIIWNRQKIHLKEEQIASELQYEMNLQHIFYDEKGFTISKNVDFENMGLVSQFFYSFLFLDTTSFRQSWKLQKEKLKALKTKTISQEEVCKNMIQNRNFVDLRKLKEDMEIRYFEPFDRPFQTELSFLSGFWVIFALICAFAHLGKESLTNFYLPVVLAFLLVITLSSKNQKRVVSLKEKREQVEDVLNFIDYCKTDSQEICYRVALEMADLKECEQITEILKKNRVES